MMDAPQQSHELLRAQLQRLVKAIITSGRAVLPRSDADLLQSIVEAAARIFGAAAASIALVNEEKQYLEFKVAYGAGNENLVGLTIPLDQGLAGYVAMTGQPLAISNVQQDQRFNQSFAQRTGYVPRSILATPLLSGDRVIGVMEVLDKISSSSFGMQDMELLSLFARQAAIAIHQSQQFANLEEALLAGLQRLAVESGENPEGDLVSTLEDISRMPGELPLSDLADAFYAISALGEAEQRACLKVLAAFESYARSRANFF